MSEMSVGSAAEIAFAENRETICAIPDDRERTNFMTERDYMGETIDLIAVVERDYDELIKGRLKPHYADTLKTRLDCYVVAHANYNALLDKVNGAKREWDDLAPTVIELKKNIIHEVRFIKKESGDSDAVKYLNTIAVGVGRRDLCMDCMELSKFCENHSKELVEEGFDMTWVDQIKGYYDVLSGMLEKINAVPAEVKEAEVIMRKAYTWLHEATSTIRKYGQHIFWRDTERLDDYKSDHYQD